MMTYDDKTRAQDGRDRLGEQFHEHLRTRSAIRLRLVLIADLLFRQECHSRTYRLLWRSARPLSLAGTSLVSNTMALHSPEVGVELLDLGLCPSSER